MGGIGRYTFAEVGASAERLARSRPDRNFDLVVEPHVLQDDQHLPQHVLLQRVQLLAVRLRDDRHAILPELVVEVRKCVALSRELAVRPVVHDKHFAAH